MDQAIRIQQISPILESLYTQKKDTRVFDIRIEHLQENNLANHFSLLDIEFTLPKIMSPASKLAKTTIRC